MTLVENPSMSLQGAAKTPWRKTKQKTTRVETLMTTSPLDMPHDYSCNAAKCRDASCCCLDPGATAGSMITLALCPWPFMPWLSLCPPLVVQPWSLMPVLPGDVSGGWAGKETTELVIYPKWLRGMC